MPSADDYVGLITPFHAGKPKFEATARLLTQPLAELQALLADMPRQFDLDEAIGAQLDVVGQWVGRSRFVATPLPDLYFSFDDAPRGFDLGVWKGPYDSDTGITRLDDDTYRLLLRAKIAANTWDGTVAGMAEALAYLFPSASGTHVFAQDNGDMSMTVGVAGHIPTLVFLALLSKGYLPLKPEGVRTYYSVTSVQNSALFGFDVQNEFVAGFDAGAWGVAPDYFVNFPAL